MKVGQACERNDWGANGNMRVSNVSELGMHQGITNGRCISQKRTKEPPSTRDPALKKASCLEEIQRRGFEMGRIIGLQGNMSYSLNSLYPP